MQYAFNEALHAYIIGEVPIGAIVVDKKNTIIGKGYNMIERLKDPSAHAEIQAMTAACNYLGNKYLSNCVLYVTLEPCNMCLEASYLFMIKRIVCGSKNYHKKSIYNNLKLDYCDHKNKYSHFLKNFFQNRRKLKF